ncbi:hypothetical protein HHI36_018209 [Cryptolaemus montrouzieri]|uniref:Uncharacterized protein n=1 Tax=Cryptolaemus montrouzieri TaxID=559131 RepID=A0ABD2NZH8_9CUCU
MELDTLLLPQVTNKAMDNAKNSVKIFKNKIETSMMKNNIQQKETKRVRCVPLKTSHSVITQPDPITFDNSPPLDQPSHDNSITLNNSQINSNGGDSIVLSQYLDTELKVTNQNLVVKSKAQENDISNNREISEVSEN